MLQVSASVSSLSNLGSKDPGNGTLVPTRGNASGCNKRIPASLMKMRRESLQVSGKYKLPAMDEGELPYNSLLVNLASRPPTRGAGADAGTITTGISAISKSPSAVVASFLSNSANGNKTASQSMVAAFCTPKRTTAKSLQTALAQASSHLKMPRVDAHSDSRSVTDAGKTDATFDDLKVKPRIRRCQTIDNNQLFPALCSFKTEKGSLSDGEEEQLLRQSPATRRSIRDMNNLVHTGLATPRRINRSTLATDNDNKKVLSSSNHSKRRSKLRSKDSTASMKRRSLSRADKDTVLSSKSSSHSKKSSDAQDLVEASARASSSAVRPKRCTKTSGDVDQDPCTPRSISKMRTVKSNSALPASSKQRRPSADETKYRCGNDAKLAPADDDKASLMLNLEDTKDHSASTTLASTLTEASDSILCGNTSNATDDNNNSTSNLALTAMATWQCACGESDNKIEQNFCGMCGTTQRWECSDCFYANKCKFKFCGLCGIIKTANREG